jgi:hypothetical protein
VQRPGAATATLNYYRALLRNATFAPIDGVWAAMRARVRVPVLAVMGACARVRVCVCVCVCVCVYTPTTAQRDVRADRRRVGRDARARARAGARGDGWV